MASPSTSRLLQLSYFRGVGRICHRQLSAGVQSATPRTHWQLFRTVNSLGRTTVTVRTLHDQRPFSTSSSYKQEHHHHHEEDVNLNAEDNWGTTSYPGHIPTSLFQKALLSVGASYMSITNPARGDMIAVLGETTGYFALIRMRQLMMSDPVGKQILLEKPRINTRTVDLDYLHQLPADTYGKQYADWLVSNRCSPDERSPVHFVDDPDLAYVMQRYREIHDPTHVLFGMPTHMLGEVVIKWVEALQLGLPMCVSAALLGPVRLKPKHLALYRNTHMWWAIRNGYKARFIMNVYFEREWETPMDELRAKLNIDPPPPTTPPRTWKNTIDPY